MIAGFVPPLSFPSFSTHSPPIVGLGRRRSYVVVREQKERLQVFVGSLDGGEETESVDLFERCKLALEDNREGLLEPDLEVEERRPSRILSGETVVVVRDGLDLLQEGREERASQTSDSRGKESREI